MTGIILGAILVFFCIYSGVTDGVEWDEMFGFVLGALLIVMGIIARIMIHKDREEERREEERSRREWELRSYEDSPTFVNIPSTPEWQASSGDEGCTGSALNAGMPLPPGMSSDDYLDSFHDAD